jgi:hypothetical protein
MTKTVMVNAPTTFFGNTELGGISLDSNWIVVSGADGGSRIRTSFRTTGFKFHEGVLPNPTRSYKPVFSA